MLSGPGAWELSKAASLECTTTKEESPFLPFLSLNDNSSACSHVSDDYLAWCLIFPSLSSTFFNPFPNISPYQLSISSPPSPSIPASFFHPLASRTVWLVNKQHDFLRHCLHCVFINSALWVFPFNKPTEKKHSIFGNDGGSEQDYALIILVLTDIIWGS